MKARELIKIPSEFPQGLEDCIWDTDQTTKHKMVPTWTLDMEKGGYICNACLLKINHNPSPDKDKGIISLEDLICPVCSSKDKQPTPRLDVEEIERRKVEIRSRLNSAIRKLC